MSLDAVKFNSFGYLTNADNNLNNKVVDGGVRVTSPVEKKPPQEQLVSVPELPSQKVAQVGTTDGFMKNAFATVNSVNSPVADYDFMDCTV